MDGPVVQHPGVQHSPDTANGGSDAWLDEDVDLETVRKQTHENELRTMQSAMETAGYREGLHAVKNKAEQEGFSTGVFQGAQVAVSFGQLCGFLKGLEMLITKARLKETSEEATKLKDLILRVNEFHTATLLAFKAGQADFYHSVQWRAQYSKFRTEVTTLCQVLRCEPPQECYILAQRLEDQKGHDTATAASPTPPTDTLDW